MAILTTAPRGTQDILPRETHKWQQVERMALETARTVWFSGTPISHLRTY